MKKVYQIVAMLFIVALTSCSSEQSLQEYFVDSAENPNFFQFDIPSSVLNLKNADITNEQKDAVKSLRKLNVLAFKKSDENASEFEVERTKVKAILKGNDFVELMKVNTPYGKATIKYIGDEDAIDEVIIYGDNKEKGFAVIRVLGNDMNPANIVQLIEAMQKSDYAGEGLGPLQELLKS